MIVPFTVNVSQAVLDDLVFRLKHTRCPDQITGSGWEYGADLGYMQELTAYWIDRFNWRNVEDQINCYPNFLATVDNVKIHFIHVKSENLINSPATEIYNMNCKLSTINFILSNTI